VQGPPTRLVQSAKWKFLLFAGAFKLVVDVTKHTEGNVPTVEFHLVQSKFMRYFKGRWAIEALSTSTCRVTYTLEVEPTLSPPPALASYTAKIFVRQAQAVLEDLEAELRRRTRL
jgi:ribosome-associated toxin RatA of RatAB toxin-antitoxin module